MILATRRRVGWSATPDGKRDLASRLPQSRSFVRQDGDVRVASSFAGPYAGYGWLLVVLAVGVGISILRRLLRLTLLLGLGTVAVLLWRALAS